MNIGDCYINNSTELNVVIVKITYDTIYYRAINEIPKQSFILPDDDLHWSKEKFISNYTFSQKLTDEYMIKDIIE